MENLIDHEHADKVLLRFKPTTIEEAFNLSFVVRRIKREILQVT
jgi:hypothetical protein